MKAILLKDFGPVTNFIFNENIPMPPCGDNDVLVKIRAVGFNPIDYQMRQGKTERKRMHSRILGREFSGVVVKTGKRVALFRAGDQVFAASGSMGTNGTYAEYVSVPEDILAIKPARLTFEEAAAVSQGYLTAWQILSRLPAKKEDAIFISGAAGSVGLALVKLLLHKGYTRLIVTAGNSQSIRQLINAGLKEHQIVNYRQADLAAKIISANGEVLFNHSVDLVGGMLSEICAEVMITNGTYADVTALTIPQAREELFNKGALILNISNYAYSLSGDKKWYGNNLRKIAALLTENAITIADINIIGGFSVQTVATAHTLMEENKTRGRKLIMRVETGEKPNKYL